jgi:signal transduction histidine kinase
MINGMSAFFLSRIDTARLNWEETRDSSVSTRRIMRIFRSALLVGIGYYVGTRVGFYLTPHGQPNSTFWPPNAILLAGLLLAHRRTWWVFLLAVLPAHLLAQLQTGVPFWTAIGWFITNTSEALIGAFLITRFTRGKIFDSARGVVNFVVFGVVIAPLVTSFLDAAAVVITGWGHGYWPLGAERFWTNALAELTVVPTIVICGSNGISWIREASVARWCEAALLALGSVSVTALVFGLRPVSPATIPALLYAPLLLLLWATVRFGSGGMSACLLCIAPISIWHLMQGTEPFSSASMPENVLSLQILFCIVAVPLLFLSALMHEARRTEDSLRKISGSLINAQEQERHRIARELHDDLGQQLALASAQLDGLIQESDASLKPNLADLSDQISAISNATREISHGLYPSQLEYLGLASAVRRMCHEIGHGKQISIQLAVGDLPHLQPSISLCLYRVVQEALHNVMKHSLADRVEVQLGSDNQRVMLQITDNGVGFDVSRQTKGLGLHSMRERVRSVDGTIEIVSAPKTGTRIEVLVSLRQGESQRHPFSA